MQADASCQGLRSPAILVIGDVAAGSRFGVAAAGLPARPRARAGMSPRRSLP
ncbi:hypothetical protein [Achromobacter sp. DMS1]|uniref:hypothetical protein n=1 Tax=Achromobacter sp. DMS1 TaxID=1688405 RepID=UPI000AE4D708|nr:hypothetical protein [Achromobacter sp. DMS1]